jgi:hypothetical protein
MQRQLNLSPAPKQQQQQHDGGGAGDGSDATEAIPLWVPEASAEGKTEKAAGGRAERSIHLIPLLTFLCFLLLFLCSHIPSASGKLPHHASARTDLDADVDFPSDHDCFPLTFQICRALAVAPAAAAAVGGRRATGG